MKKWEPILLKWVDSMGHNAWQSESDLKRDIEKTDELLHESVGMFFHRDKESITIVQSRHHTGRMVDNAMQIPLRAVKRVIPLQEVKS